MGQFYFKPLSEKKITLEEKELNVTIQSNGQLSFKKWTASNLGFNLETGVFLMLYEDTERRALGFKVIQNFDGHTKPKGMRFVKPTLNKRYDSLCFKISIIKFLARLPNVYLPYKNLEIKKYKDTSMGDLYYIQIPTKPTEAKQEVTSTP